MKTWTLLERFRFHRERDEAPMAYWIARRRHVAERYDLTENPVPTFLTLLWIGGRRNGDDHQV